MTLHINYNHQCPKCGAYYIPYKDGDKTIACPKCGHVGDEAFDFIPKAVNSVKFNLREYGSYTPLAWATMSLGDHILRILFGILEGYSKEVKGKNFEKYAKEYLSKMVWGNQEYLRDHILGIALIVKKELDNEE